MNRRAGVTASRLGIAAVLGIVGFAAAFFLGKATAGDEAPSTLGDSAAEIAVRPVSIAPLSPAGRIPGLAPSTSTSTGAVAPPSPSPTPPPPSPPPSSPPPPPPSTTTIIG